MIQALVQTLTIPEFLVSYPENSQYCYELHQGYSIAMAPPKAIPNGKHEEIIGFLTI
jgi:Uma2 family endonuclease